MTQHPVADELRDLILRHIESGAELPDDEFNALALAIFSFQYARNEIYRRFCDSRGRTPENVAGWEDVPAVPTEAFRAAPLVCGDPASVEAVFRTSGTTGGSQRRGTHYLLDTSLYRAALRAGFQSALLPDRDRIRVLSLVPAFADLPDSSLSFMIDDVMRTFGTADSGYFVSAEGLRMDELPGALESAARDGSPILVVGTSFAFVHLLDHMRDARVAVQLPPGSRIMDTGGFKGRSREIGREELYHWMGERLGVPFSGIVNEYGMTEMSSQFYDGVAGKAPGAGEPRIHRGPPWVRSVAVDPEDLAPLPPGKPGILRHLDLANLHSVMALQTADFGVVVDGGIELRGRVAGAPPRGCSIAMDEFLAVTRGT